MSYAHATQSKRLDVSKAIRQAIKLHRQLKLDEAERLYAEILAAEPDHFDALHMLGVLRLTQGQLPEAFDLISRALAIDGRSWRALYNYGRVLSALERYEEAAVRFAQAVAIEPGQADVHFCHAISLHKLNRLEDALASYDKAIAIRARHGAFYNRGRVLLDLQRYEDALVSYDEALKIKPDYFQAHDNRGIALCYLKRYEEALESHDRALALNPNYAEAHNNRGNALRELERNEDALAAFDGALAIRPDFVSALYNRGKSLDRLGLHAEALLSYNEALAVDPNDVRAINNRGTTLRALGRNADALAAFDRALAVDPNYVEAISNRGSILRRLNRFEEALACCDQALTMKPDFYQPHLIRSNTLRDMHRHEEALESYDRTLEVKPDSSEAYYGRGRSLYMLGRIEEAIASFERAVEIEPDHHSALGSLFNGVMSICDWAKVARLAQEVEIHVAEAKSAIAPFPFLHYSGSPEAELRCAQNFFEKLYTDQTTQPMWRGEVYSHDKIRVAYASADFYWHNTGYLMAELFELHDRRRFEVIGISWCPEDGSSMRKRLVKAFDQFHDVRNKGDREVAELLRGLQADIVVDLKGYTQGCRPAILGHRPAPIHVNYLGYQGTMGTAFVDYIIGDELALPFELQPYFTEQIVHLPVCHQVNDSTVEIPSGAPPRSEVGLPEEGFVFCCFNNSAKITSPIFDVWMRLLDAVDGSVLWLMEENAPAKGNLRREASARGIDPARLVFAPFAPIKDHLRRHRLADIFLDTLPMTAHTSASRALWAGLPILTCTGNTFAGRISASLLQGAGLSELITHSLEEYEALAKALARHPSRLQGHKRHLEDHRRTCSLFDTDRFRRHIEAAYTTMWEKYQRGDRPRSFAVAPV